MVISLDVLQGLDEELRYIFVEFPLVVRDPQLCWQRASVWDHLRIILPQCNLDVEVKVELFCVDAGRRVVVYVGQGPMISIYWLDTADLRCVERLLGLLVVLLSFPFFNRWLLTQHEASPPAMMAGFSRITVILLDSGTVAQQPSVCFCGKAGGVFHLMPSPPA